MISADYNSKHNNIFSFLWNRIPIHQMGVLDPNEIHHCSFCVNQNTVKS